MSLHSNYASEAHSTVFAGHHYLGLHDLEVAPKGLSEAALARAKAFIASHLYERFTLSDLAAAACMSRYHFTRLFRASTGSTTMDFVMQARVEEAKRILARGDQTLSETAAALCFCDQSHFTRTFRRITGISPRTFLNMQLHSDPLLT